MKKLFYTSILLLSIACSKDYLNEPKPTAQISGELVYGSRSGVEAYISGILRMVRTLDGNFNTGGMDAMYTARSVKGKDIIALGPFMWWIDDYKYEDRAATHARPIFSWKYPYEIIRHVNFLLEGIENSDNLSESDKKELAAQGYALRGFYYFQLAQEFQLTYTHNPNAPAPPIVTKPNQEDQPMSALKDMYTLIVSDLEKAVADASTTRLGKSYIDKNVAAGILARVYQVMAGSDPSSEYWHKAEKMAHLAYGGSVAAALDPESYGDGFNDIQNKEWIWGMPQRSDQTLYFATAPSTSSDPKSPGTSLYIDKDFVDTFSDTDVRNLFTENKKAKIKAKTFTNAKFTFSFDADMVLMRTAEMILIEAEAKYWQGEEVGAHDLLYALQQNRDPQAVKSSNAGDALLDEILLERRKELYLEIGTEWYDARRLQRGITRSAYHPSDIDLTANDKRFYLKVPQAEIDANDQIDESVNAGR
ncbi:MAG: RagB/SusD family nutrient uptake outer membrane protein [Flavobacteriales bacterium]